ncbi:hypothetical protein B0H15DRAFT_785890, partial [Mycena belliarum]
STNDWKGKKVVLFSVSGAFTPTYHTNHLPPYLAKHAEFKAKGLDVIAVVAANDLEIEVASCTIHSCHDCVRNTKNTYLRRNRHKAQSGERGSTLRDAVWEVLLLASRCFDNLLLVEIALPKLLVEDLKCHALDNVDTIDDITQRLAHFAPMSVPNHRMAEYLIERHPACKLDPK